MRSARIHGFFGDRRTYLYSDGTEARSIHNGIDFAAPKGTAVYSSAGGKVIFAGEWLITGNTVIVEYLPGVFGLYFHLNEILVSQGDYVGKGEKLGTIGNSGLATGPHLHWEIWINGVPVNPLTWTQQTFP